MSEQGIDQAAAAATDQPGDEVQGERRGPGEPSSVPGAGRAELGEQEDVPATEGARQVAETVRSISRLEESN